MNAPNQGTSIQELLNGLSPAQRQKALDFIKSMARYNQEEKAQEIFKREALKEIGLALGKNRILKPFF